MNPVNPICAPRSTRETCAGKRLWHWGWILLGALLIAPSTAGAVLDTFLAEARALFPDGLARPALVCPLATNAPARRNVAPDRVRNHCAAALSRPCVLADVPPDSGMSALVFPGRPGPVPDNPRAPPA
ncbi:MAG: hypothetical protein ACOVT5_10290 [Armatimonadaceae bacterium]